MQNPRCLKTTVAGDSGKLGRCRGGIPIPLLRWKLETRRGISFQDIFCAVWWARVPVPAPLRFRSRPPETVLCLWSRSSAESNKNGLGRPWAVPGMSCLVHTPLRTPIPSTLLTGNTKLRGLSFQGSKVAAMPGPTDGDGGSSLAVHLVGRPWTGSSICQPWLYRRR